MRGHNCSCRLLLMRCLFINASFPFDNLFLLPFPSPESFHRLFPSLLLLSLLTFLSILSSFSILPPPLPDFFHRLPPSSPTLITLFCRYSLPYHFLFLFFLYPASFLSSSCLFSFLSHSSDVTTTTTDNKRGLQHQRQCRTMKSRSLTASCCSWTSSVSNHVCSFW